MFLLNEDGKPQKKAEQLVECEPGEATPVELRLAAPGEGSHQGLIKIAGGDNLPAPNDVAPSELGLIIETSLSNEVFDLAEINIVA